MSKKDLEERMLEFDIDKDGTIGFDEFLCLMKEIVSDVHDENRLQEVLLQEHLPNMNEYYSLSYVMESILCYVF